MTPNLEKMTEAILEGKSLACELCQRGRALPLGRSPFPVLRMGRQLYAIRFGNPNIRQRAMQPDELRVFDLDDNFLFSRPICYPRVTYYGGVDSITVNLELRID